MILYRSFLNGIGTGAGVAWPLFGIVFALLGGAIGGYLSLALGIVCITLFLVVSIAIFYFSYQDMKSKDVAFQDNLNKNKHKLSRTINDYLQKIHERYLKQDVQPNFARYLSATIHQNLNETRRKDKNSSLSQLLEIINSLIDEDLHNGIILNEKKFFEQIENSINNIHAPPFTGIIPAFSAFVGSFGSIAGCSAGISGLLTGIGLFTSFATIPIIGWIIIGAAIVSSILIAIGAYKYAQDEYHNNQFKALVKSMYQQLKSVNFQTDLDTDLKLTSPHTSTDIVNPDNIQSIVTQELSQYSPIFKLTDDSHENIDESVLSASLRDYTTL
ncbi:MAG: hypothetical protein WC627_10880 [Legionella sp.]|jgi:hypothetical protein